MADDSKVEEQENFEQTAWLRQVIRLRKLWGEEFVEEVLKSIPESYGPHPSLETMTTYAIGLFAKDWKVLL